MQRKRRQCDHPRPHKLGLQTTEPKRTQLRDPKYVNQTRYARIKRGKASLQASEVRKNKKIKSNVTHASEGPALNNVDLGNEAAVAPDVVRRAQETAVPADAGQATDAIAQALTARIGPRIDNKTEIGPEKLWH